ncbi:MAG: phage portal protein [Methanobrevibacter sp.]|uniref:phage portal protein n=1 Tax=Methanobrevibacter sp. TaxID=66852 RepID=UPI0031F49490|nr:phage portal protein [Methanobrevibacter sp.]
MLKVNEILEFIREDAISEKKRLAKIGQNYYDGKHDILNYRLFYYNADGELVEDKTRSNIKIPHPFFTELVDQEVQYMLSDDDFVKSDIPELQDELDKYFNDDFISELSETLTFAVTNGFAYMYAYKSKDDITKFVNAESAGVIEVRAKDTDDHCEYIIYWYIDRIEKGKKKIKRIQVWDKHQTYYYVQENDGELKLDEDEEINPRPHIIYTKDNSEQKYYNDLGYIPFFRLDNNKKQVSSLTPIKALIDDYDLMACGLSNNLQDFDHPIYAVSGFQGDNLDELVQNVKTKKTIGMDVGGGLDIKTVDIPFQARQTKLALDETNIYRFGMGFNSAQIGDGNITNIVIKSRYALLDLKCNKLEKQLRRFLNKILRVVLDEINTKNGTDYSLKDVYYDFEREVMTNASDNAQINLVKAQTKQVEINTLLNTANVIGQEEAIKQICDVLDIDYETIKSEQMAVENILNGVVVEDEQMAETNTTTLV